MLPGAHPALNYRGNAGERSKIWLSTHFDEGYVKYGYTGWQWLVAFAQRPIETFPLVHTALDRLNTFLPAQLQLNHCIGTLYYDGTDNIGYHSDKIRDWTENSPFIAVKLGAARHFAFSQEGVEIFNEILQPGTAVIVGYDANQQTKHAVPVEPFAQASGSLVFRSISTRIPWPAVKQKQLKSSALQGRMRVRKALQGRKSKQLFA